MDDFELDPEMGYQPVFIRTVSLIGLCLFALHILMVLAGVVMSIINGDFFRHPISEVFGGSPVYWAIFDSCVAIAAVLVGGFAILLCVSLVVWMYRSAMRIHPIPRAKPDKPLTKVSPIYWVLISYSVLFGGTTLFGIIRFADNFITTMTADGNSFGLGMLILVGPFVLIACVAIIMFIFWFCAMLIPGVAISRRLVSYITRPSTIPVRD